MAKKSTVKDTNETEKVDAFMEKSGNPFREEIQAVRSIIRNVDGRINERIKWNAPSFFCGPDLAAFNLRAKGYAQLIMLFPNGLVKDDSGLLLGDWKDRREARFYSMEDVRKKQPALEEVVRGWLKLIEESEINTNI